MADPKTWVEIVGYRHEVLHTGVLAGVLEGDTGPAVAERLTSRATGSIKSVHSVFPERKLSGARGKADLTAQLVLAGGEEVSLAIETKVHSDGTCKQLEMTTETTGPSEGVLLALGLTSLKFGPLHMENVTESSDRQWHLVGPTSWTRALDAVSDEGRPWLADYKDSLTSWTDHLTGRQALELEHLRWMNQLLPQLPRPASWREITTSQSGPLLSLFDWTEDPKMHIYLEFMGHHSGRRELCLKIGGGDQSEIDLLTDRLEATLPVLTGFQPGGRRRGKSRTVAKTRDFGPNSTEAAKAAVEAAGLLDELYGRGASVNAG